MDHYSGTVGLRRIGALSLVAQPSSDALDERPGTDVERRPLVRGFRFDIEDIVPRFVDCDPSRFPDNEGDDVGLLEEAKLPLSAGSSPALDG